jgi:hypothetical protein
MGARLMVSTENVTVTFTLAEWEVLFDALAIAQHVLIGNSFSPCIQMAEEINKLEDALCEQV